LLALPGPGRATDMPVTVLQSPRVQAETVKALQAIDQGRWTLGRDIIARTKDPLASKLYYWLLFTREKGGDQRFLRLAQFVHQNPEWPGTDKLRTLIEEEMPASLEAADVIAWFDDNPAKTAAGMDRYVQALIFTGRTQQAKTVLADWWANTLLSREQQKDIYSKYHALIDMKAHVKRLDTLLFAAQYTNARAIAGVLGKGYPELTEARIALAEEKGNESAYIARVPHNLRNDAGLLYERLRWRRRHNLDVEAIEILHHAPPPDTVQNPAAWWQERHILIRRLLEKKMYESAYLLASKHMQKEGVPYADAEWLSGWLALRFMKDAPRALQHFEALYHKVGTPISKARAAYWAGRAAKALGQPVLADQWFKDAARFQTVFYGQLAGAEIGVQEALPNAAPPLLTGEDLAALNARELVQAARLFNAAGMSKESSRFLQAFINSEPTPKAYRFAAEQAAEMKRYHDAIRIAKEATNKGLFLTAQSYPLINERLGSVRVEWALVHALIRQESMFDSNAQSPAGALGLMQLMPATAQETAKKAGLRYQPGMLTGNPDYNIRLGTAYIQEMLARFSGSYPLAIAAYNAGPSRVAKWIDTFGDPRTKNVDLIDWIEMIPISETRNYVQRVMEGVYVYRLRLHGVQDSPAQSIHVATQE
jgi:soluble lytic murein transglycosylase